MKKIIVLTIAALFMTAPIFGTVYTDPTNDLDAAVNNDNLNFTGAEVTNDITTISFTINILGDIQSVNWGKYMIGINSVAGGDTNGNAWARPISMSSGMNYWLGGWVDAANDNVQLWHYDNGAWTNTAVYTSTIHPNSVVYSAPLSALGLTPGSSFTFDIYSSGGGAGDTRGGVSGDWLGGRHAMDRPVAGRRPNSEYRPRHDRPARRPRPPRRPPAGHLYGRGRGRDAGHGAPARRQPRAARRGLPDDPAVRGEGSRTSRRPLRRAGLEGQHLRDFRQL